MLTACKQTPDNIFLQEWDTPYGTAPFSKITADQYLPAFKAGLEEQKANVEANAFRQPPKWLEYDANNMVAKVVAAPAREDIDLPVEEHLIVELYSK